MNMFTLAAAASEAGKTAEKAAEKSSLGEILLIALVGFVTVFVVLVVLMFIISLISKVFSENKPEKSVPEIAPAPAADENERVDSYTGVKLINVSDKDAALIMAIVADGLDMPLDNLRFISIKEVQ